VTPPNLFCPPPYAPAQARPWRGERFQSFAHILYSILLRVPARTPVKAFSYSCEDNRIGDLKAAAFMS